MPEVAFVTRTFASRTFESQAPNNVGDEVGVGYVLRDSKGQNLGMYRSVSEAQHAFARRYGPNRILKWKQQNLGGDIEQHVAVGLPLSPQEIWLTNLVEWSEPSLVPGSVSLQDVALQTIRQVSDLSGQNNFSQQTVTASQPTLASGGTFNGSAVVEFDGSVPQLLLTPNLITLTPPYIIIAVANSTLNDGGDVFIITTAGDDLVIGGDGAGAWELRVGAASLLATDLPPLSAPAILVARVTATLTEFRLNGVSQGSIAGVPAANGTLTLGFGIDALTGSIAAVMIALGATDPNDARILQSERWFRSRYQ